MRTTVWCGILAACLAFPRPTPAQDAWDRADSATTRLPPSGFSQLPPGVRRALEERGCMIPQSSERRQPHNVIRGEFQQPGQLDWAVLCSRARVSTILVFWKGNPAEVDSVARHSGS